MTQRGIRITYPLPRNRFLRGWTVGIWFVDRSRRKYPQWWCRRPNGEAMYVSVDPRKEWL